jgi:hypothetical protein
VAALSAFFLIVVPSIWHFCHRADPNSHSARYQATPSPTSPASQLLQASPPLPVTSPSPITATPSSPVTFAEIVRVESDNTLTDLQKDEFRRKHQGKIVEWTVRVLSVNRQWEREDSDFSVVFRSPYVKSPRFGETGVATFPASLRDDMVDLHSGDIIRFRGMLKFIGPVHYLVAVNNCQLLEHHK